MIEEVKEVLKDWKASRGGSYIFEKETWFRPDWLTGCYVKMVRIQIHPPTDWAKVSYHLSEEEEFEKFYEGRCKDIEDFKKILELLEIDP